MNKQAILDKLSGFLDLYEPNPIRVGDLDVIGFCETFGDSIDHKITLRDKGTVFVIIRPRIDKKIFLAWHFDSDGRFVDYVERVYPPAGLGDYRWIDEVCAAVQGEEPNEG